MTTPKPSVRLERVTPALADKYLGTQLANRPLRDARVDHWVAIVRAGEWRLSNDAIAFDQNGNLINGQHRLTAVVVTGVSLEFIVARNLPTENQDIMDSGLMRATSDALKLRGEASVTALAAGLRWEAKLRLVGILPDRSVITNKFPVSTPQLLGIFEEDAEVWRRSVKAIQVLMHQVRIRPGPGSALYRRFGLLDQEHRDAFFHGLATGEDLGGDDPILQLRNLLMNSHARGFKKMVDYREVALITKAWNMWRAGEHRGQLVWHYGATTREEFPLPQ